MNDTRREILQFIWPVMINRKKIWKINFLRNGVVRSREQNFVHQFFSYFQIGYDTNLLSPWKNNEYGSVLT